MADQPLWAPHTHAGRRVPLAWVQLLRAQSLLTRRMNANLLGEHGLTINDYEVLLRLSWADEGRLRRRDIAESVHLTQGGITRILQGLEDAGLVRSEKGESDRRVVYARLTELGRQRLEKAASLHVADISELFTSRLSAADLRALTEILSHLVGPVAPSIADSPGPRS